MASSKTSGQKPKFVLKRQRTESEPPQPPKRVRVDEPSKLKSKLKKLSAPKAAAPPQPQKGGFVKAKGKETAKPKPAIPSISGKAIKTKAKAATAPPTPDPLPTAFKVIAGSYEKLLYGLQGSASLSDEGSLSFSLKPVFIFPAHVSSVKALAASPGGGKWLASGSVDEIIKVWDLRRRKEVGGLMHHSGSITHLTFADRSHLFSASEDGTLALFHTRDWGILRTFKGHKGRVNAIAVHPSSKLALSVGKDRTLRMWDLMRGKASASTKIYKEGEAIRWNTAGTLFAVASGQSIDVYNVGMSLLYSVTHAARIHDILFVEEGKESKHSVLLVAAENKKVSAYLVPSSPPQPEIQEDNDDEEEVSTLKVFAECIGHSNRVKALASLRMALPVSPTQTRSYTTILTTISSDGKVLVYDLAPLASAASASSSSEAATEASEILQLSPVAEYDSAGSRLTCLTVAEDTTAVATSTTGLGAVRNLTGDTKPADGEEAGSAFDAAVEGSGSEDDEELEGEDEEEMEEEDEEEDEA